MKRPWWVRAVLLATFTFAFLGVRSGQAQDANSARVARLSQAEGQVQIAHPGSDHWEDAVPNLPIQEGDVLGTASGRAGVEFENGATAYLAENSTLEFTELTYAGDSRLTQLKVTQGAVTFYANLTGGDTFYVVAPTFEVDVPERAEFRVDTYRDGASVEVLGGNATVSTRDGSTSLEQGQSVAVHEGEVQPLNVSNLPAPDEFDQWVTSQRDTIQTSTKGALQYISTPQYYGLSELSVYGTWVTFPGYGPCWRPFGALTGWAPFLNGNWVLDPRLGWVWVSNEPWGWLPYHFGSWLLTPTLGWIWVPGGPAGLRQWEPSRVHFFHVGNQTAWVARSPDDRESSPANAPHGMITRPAATSRSASKMSNQFVTAKESRTATPIAKPPEEFAKQPALPPRAGNTSTVQSAPQPSNNGGIVFDRKTQTYVNGNGSNTTTAPTSPAPPKSMARPEGPREPAQRTAPAESPINRVNLPPPYAVAPRPTILPPSSAANKPTAPAKVSPPTANAQPSGPAVTARPGQTVPPATPAQPSSQPRYSSAPRPPEPEPNQTPAPSTGSSGTPQKR